MKHTTHLYCLSNGIPVVVSNTFFQTCKILISLDFGASDETQGEYGITHFIEHLLGQSVTGESSFAYLKKKIETLGGNINLCTNHERMCCCVNVIPEHLIDVIQIIAPQIMTPLFDAQNIEKEKNVILNEYKRSNDNNSWRLFMYENLFKNTGFAHNILGTPETIQAFNKELLSDYYFSHLSNDKCNIVVVGQINDTQKLLSELETAFGKMPHVHYEHNVFLIQQTVAHDFKLNMQNTKMAIAFAAQTSNDRKHQIAIGLFRKILQDRLYDVLRYKNGLVYAIQCSTIGSMDNKLYLIETESEVQELENITKKIAITCKNVLNSEPITSAELQSVKNAIKFHNARMMDSIDKNCNLYASYMLHYGELYDFNKEQQILHDLNLDDIMTTGKNLLNAPLSAVTQGPQHDCHIVEIWDKNFIN